MKNSLQHLSILVLSFSLSGCGSFKSYPPVADGILPETASNKQGLHYFLPRARLEIEGKYNDIKGADGKTTVRREYGVNVKKYHVADPQAPVFAEITENVMYDEDSVMTVKDGLLQSANAKPEDKTGEIIVTLAGTAIDAARIAASGPTALSPENRQRVKAPVTPFLVDFDPFNEAEVGDARAIIKRAGFALTLPGKVSMTGRPALPSPGKTRSKKVSDHHNGLAFRPPTALRVELALDEKSFEYQHEMEGDKVKTPSNGALKYRSSLTAPNVSPGSIAYVPVQRGFMVKRQTNVTFENGIPTVFDLKAPSPVLGFVKVPAAVVKMVADAVPTLIKVQRDTAKSEVTYQTELIKAQSDLIKAQNDLNNLKAAAP